MFDFTSLEDAALLSITLIDAALLTALLLIAIRTCSSAVRSYILAFLVLAVLAALFVHEQVLNISDERIEAFDASSTLAVILEESIPNDEA